MTTSLPPTASLEFLFRNRTVRMMVIEGQYWFRAADIISLFGLSRAQGKKVLSSIAPVHKQFYTHPTLSSAYYPLWLISYSSLYHFAYHVPEYRFSAFMNWLSLEALPGCFDGKVHKNMSVYLSNMLESLIRVSTRSRYFLYMPLQGSVLAPVLCVTVNEVRRMVKRMIHATWIQLDESSGEVMKPLDRDQAYRFSHTPLTFR